MDVTKTGIIRGKLLLKNSEEIYWQIKVNNRELKEVDHFKYLGSVLTRDGYCTRQIKMRIAIVK